MKLNDSISTYDVAEALQGETGKFEVTSPNGERYFVTCQPGHSIVSLESAASEINLQPFLVRKVAHRKSHKEVCHCLAFVWQPKQMSPALIKPGSFTLHPFYSYVARQLGNCHEEEVSPKQYSHAAHDAADDDNGVDNWIEICHLRTITLTPETGYQVFTACIHGVCPMSCPAPRINLNDRTQSSHIRHKSGRVTLFEVLNLALCFLFRVIHRLAHLLPALCSLLGSGFLVRFVDLLRRILGIAPGFFHRTLGLIDYSFVR
jgi:hypothetical protein